MNSSKPRRNVRLNVPKASKITNKSTHPLLSCVFHPFDGPVHGLESLPDGDNSNRLLVDHSTYTDFTVNSGGLLTIRTMPLLPFCALFQPGAGTVITASDPALGSYTYTYGAAANNLWTPSNYINQYFPMLSNNNIYSTQVAPYSQTKFRIITQSWRLIYSGTVANGSGLVTCRDIPINVDTYVALPTGSFKMYNQQNDGFYLSSGPVQAALVDFPSSAGGLDVGKSTFTRLDLNPWGIVKRNSRLYPWTTFNEQPNNMIPASTTLAQISSAVATPLTAMVTNTSVFVSTGFNGWDNNFNSTEIRISNFNSTVTFRLEIKICVEYMVMPTSPVYSLTKHPAKPDIPVIEAVQSKSGTLPPSMNQNETITNPKIERPLTTSDVQKIKKVETKASPLKSAMDIAADKNAIDKFAKKVAAIFPTPRRSGKMVRVPMRRPR